MFNIKREIKVESRFILIISDALCVCNTLIYLNGRERPCNFIITFINLYDRILKRIVQRDRLVLQHPFAGNCVRKTHVSDYELIYEYDRN